MKTSTIFSSLKGKISWVLALTLFLAVSLSSAVLAVEVVDTCKEGGGVADIDTLSATYDLNDDQLIIEMLLCADPDVSGNKTKYRVHIDHTAPFFDDADRDGDGTADEDDFCFTTSDNGMMRRKKGSSYKDTGPGDIDTAANLLTYIVDIDDLNPGLMLGDTVYIWADTHDKGIKDRAPDTELVNANGCEKPENPSEVLAVVLDDLLTVIVGESTIMIPRADSCGQSSGRTCESLVGDATTDSMRDRYGTDFAITNAGGLRADLTCPVTDIATDFCPPFVGPNFDITSGQVLTVLPFGNQVVTYDLDGAELKAMLENGVSAMPGISGRFAQVSGLCFTYDIEAAVGSRVTGAVLQMVDGSCTGAAVDLTVGSIYSVSSNDFMASGGDGYPDFSARMTTRELMDQVLSDYVTANSPITPVIQGRINCVGASCPVILP